MNVYTMSADLIDQNKPFYIYNDKGDRKLFLPSGEIYNQKTVWWFIGWDQMRGNTVMIEEATKEEV